MLHDNLTYVIGTVLWCYRIIILALLELYCDVTGYFYLLSWCMFIHGSVAIVDLLQVSTNLMAMLPQNALSLWIDGGLRNWPTIKPGKSIYRLWVESTMNQQLVKCYWCLSLCIGDTCKCYLRSWCCIVTLNVDFISGSSKHGNTFLASVDCSCVAANRLLK